MCCRFVGKGFRFKGENWERNEEITIERTINYETNIENHIYQLLLQRKDALIFLLQITDVTSLDLFASLQLALQLQVRGEVRSQLFPHALCFRLHCS